MGTAHYSPWVHRLASFARIIIFDKRGTGMSDRVSHADLPTPEERMDDVRAVMDAVGSATARILGWSEGGWMASLFAATYPDRVRAMVLHAAYPRSIQDDGSGLAFEDRGEQQLKGVPGSWRLFAAA